MRIALFGAGCLLLLAGVFYFYDSDVERGNALLQYTSYILFMIFTMSISPKSTMSLGMRHMLGMPISKRQIVFYQSIADLTYYFPVSLVTLYGFSLAHPEYHIVLVGLIFHLVLVVANMISMNKRIDFERMQHAKASFKNAFVYVKKYIDTSIHLIILISVVAMLITVFDKKIFMMEYAFLILMTVACFLMFTKTTKMLKDESLSYFLIKRDLKDMGLKLFVVMVPILTLSYVYNAQKDEILRKIAGKKNAEAYMDKITANMNKAALQVDVRKLILDMKNDNKEGIDLFFQTHQEIPLDVQVLGNYIPHIAAETERLDVLEKLYQQDKKSLMLPGKFNKTPPLSAALRSCKLKSVEFLLDHEVDINQPDKHGNTPIMKAVQHKCYGGVVILSKRGADLELKNKKNKNLAFYLEGTGLDYIIRNHHNRKIAAFDKSEEAKNSDSKSNKVSPAEK